MSQVSSFGMLTLNQDRPRRNFQPKKTKRYGRQTFDPGYLVKYSPKWKYSRLYNFPFSGAHWQPRMRTIVISVDGGSRGNNRNDPKSRGAYGVFFGPNCYRNTNGLLPQSAPQTSSRAELEGVRQALEVVQGMKDAGEIDGWREVIIKLDSEYAAKCLSEWIWTWVGNDFMTRKGTPVEHGDLIREMHATITELEKEGAVRFWRVGREWNRDADALVNQALDGELSPILSGSLRSVPQFSLEGNVLTPLTLDAADSGYDEN
jgi:ribonuclease HI